VRIGIHTSTSGALENSAKKAIELGANTFQIFSASPRMWRAAPPATESVKRLKDLRKKHDLKPLVIHDSYLINLASIDPVIRSKSIAAYRAEIERAIQIGAEYLVAHPGSYKDQTAEQGIVSFVTGLMEAAQGLKSKKLTLLFENTAGSGAALGSRFEELAEIRRLAKSRVEFKLGFCIDTCHCLAAGYDVATAIGLGRTVAAIEKVLGLSNVPVIHANDSKTPLGSNRDRHEHIGEGHIGLEGFRRILRHPKLKSKAFILETPIDEEGDDLRNVERLKSLAANERECLKVVDDSLPFEFWLLEVEQQRYRFSGGFEVVDALGHVFLPEVFGALQLHHKLLFYNEIGDVFANRLSFVVNGKPDLRMHVKSSGSEFPRQRTLIDLFEKTRSQRI
jgi:deoxyribonuclease-4